MDKKQFVQLLKKHREGAATAGEQAFIAAYYRLLELKAGPEAALEAAEKELIKDAIRQRINEQIADEPPPKQHVRGLIIYAAKIAAAVIILLGAGIMLYTAGFRKPAAHAPLLAANVPQPPKKDSTAERNKAILTLANGQKIILDSASPGILVKEGNIDIRKKDSGELVYRNVAPTNNNQQLLNTITTPRGGKYKVILSDNTAVWLNAGSSLSYPITFHGNERKVTLTGEAYFEVAPNADQPFVVATGTTRIQVLGTHFNVNAYSDEKVIRTTLTEGAVRVVKGTESRLLKPGEQASMNKQTGALKVTAVDVEEALAWKKGLFQFNNTQLEVIMREVSRWYDMDVIYETKQLDDKRFSGIMSRYSEPAALLRRLELTGVVHFRLQGREIIVMD